MKVALILVGVFVLVAALVAGGLYSWFGRPLYSPGMVKDARHLGSPLEPPEQAGTPVGYLTVAPGIRLFTLKSGQGPAALVVHGGPGFCSGLPWEGLRALENRFELVYYHQRGCGESTHPIDTLPTGSFRDVALLDKTLGLAEQIADIERLRRLLGTERLLLVGHSFGALIAALYAAEFPEHTRGLVLLAPADLVKFPPPGGGLFEQVRSELPADRQAEYSRYVDRVFDFRRALQSDEAALAALQRDFLPFYAAAAERHGFAIAPDRSTNNGGWMVQAVYFGMGRSHDWRAPLRGVTAPVLVVHGGRDLQPEAASRRYLEYFPNARFVRLEEAGHFVFADAPAALTRELQAFTEGM